jgi:hypothetical protein
MGIWVGGVIIVFVEYTVTVYILLAMLCATCDVFFFNFYAIFQTPNNFQYTLLSIQFLYDWVQQNTGLP